MNPRTSSIAGWLILALMLCQFVPLGRVDPPSKGAGALPLPARRTLESRCGQCHSYATRWPNSAFIAPLSWYVVHEVRKARQAINLSELSGAPNHDGFRVKKRIRSLIISGNTSRHAVIPGFEQAELTPSERKQLLDWSAVPE
ncbi:MAG: heme-binding domain-containing protein [Chlorobiaceae bacterium]|nr:heme-binding domain-containing protein [Chlorobiaceae bacterium]